MAQFDDHFSKRAQAYARFRPTYPPALFSALRALVSTPQRAVDCATGSGQAACALADIAGFREVIATDASAKQLAHAKAHPRVHYRQAMAEDLGTIEDASADLVTVAAGVHWFDRSRFYAEAQRVLRPRGVIAVWTYGPQANVCPAFDALITALADDKLAADWPPQTALVRTLYRDLPFPFAPVDVGPFACEMHWTLEECLGVIKTWSGVIRFEERTKTDVFGELLPALADAWPAPHGGPARVVIPLGIRVGRRD